MSTKVVLNQELLSSHGIVFSNTTSFVNAANLKSRLCDAMENRLRSKRRETIPRQAIVCRLVAA